MDPLAVQWLGHRLSLPWTRVRFLVRELRIPQDTWRGQKRKTKWEDEVRKKRLVLINCSSWMMGT